MRNITPKPLDNLISANVGNGPATYGFEIPLVISSDEYAVYIVRVSGAEYDRGHMDVITAAYDALDNYLDIMGIEGDLDDYANSWTEE